MSVHPYRVRIVASENEIGSRVDQLVTSRLADTSRSYVQRLIEAGDIRVNDCMVRASYRVSSGDAIEVRIPPPEIPDEITPADILIPIAYEDDDVIVFDKPAGMVVHPSPGHAHGTLVNALKWIRPDAVPTGTGRPGIVHRLDRDTSGLIVIAKTERARLDLLRQWQERSVVKDYSALVIGQLPEREAIVDAPIGRDPNNRMRMAVVASGRPAVTRISTVESHRGYSLLNVRIETGRTHQIRVHCAFIGHPIAGDTLYGGKVSDIPLDRQFLHARHLHFELPGGESLDLESPLPADLQSVLDHLHSQL